MTTEPRAALDRLVVALEAHLQAASRRRSETDPAVVAAYQTLADAFEAYDEALYATYDEVTPFVLYDDAADAVDDEDDEDDENGEDLEEDEEFEDEDDEFGDGEEDEDRPPDGRTDLEGGEPEKPSR
jgi:hypothetical protein